MNRLATLGVLLALVAGARGAAPEQEAYWWLDEIRECAFALSKARSGKVAQWPRMSVPAGSGVLPVPPAKGAIALDGKLDEPAWEQATSFPVGPLFGPWREGPFHLQVRVCRDAKKLYVAIESPRDLTGLGSVGRGELFMAGGKAYRVLEGGKVAGGVARRQGTGQVLELAVPIPRNGKPGEVLFPVELARRVKGSLGPGFIALGLNRVAGANSRRGRSRSDVWLSPIRIQLVPANAPITATPGAGGKVGVTPFEWRPGGKDGKHFLNPDFPDENHSSSVESRQTPTVVVGEKLSRKSQLKGFRYVEDVESDGAAGRRAAYCRARSGRATARLSMLDAPLLVVKRRPYFAGHIYDDYITWHPGGGIYVIENPAAPFSERKIRPVIDATTKPTLGGGVYRDPEVSWDGRRILFAYKGAEGGDTSLYEIHVDGTGLRRLTDPGSDCRRPKPGTYLGKGHHDITPTYLPDGRIAFTSTRPAGRVPCFNSLVDVLHVMDADGGNVRCLSVNNVNEFDPSVLPDGRILYGRWEYVDKTALYMQSLWTVLPDGRGETALYGNNLAKPTALLDARAVPGSDRIVAALTPHNGQAVGAIATIDPSRGKNDLGAITNFTPEYPVEMDQGLRIAPCDPWALSEDDVLISNNALGAHGIIELIDRLGRRDLVYADPTISCYAPMPIAPRPRPREVPDLSRGGDRGTFAVQDVYRGLTGVKRGEVKYLRVVEETTRVSGYPPGGRWWNQAFLISWQGSYVVKNVLGVVPVAADGSAYFEVPAGRAVYFQALDADGRMVQGMRTFVQAVPGVTRSCIGCHEYKYGAPPRRSPAQAGGAKPARLKPESWGSGFVDYPTMIQPILDRRCGSCHGGDKNIAGGVDLSGGWTWAFNISYETLIKRTLTGFLNCHNSSVNTSLVHPPRTYGSGSAALAKLLVGGHKDRIKELTRPERDLLMAWMDGNCNYYGTWNYTPHATSGALAGAARPLGVAMKKAGCTSCHGGQIGNDWVNLASPEHSRILRAPLAKTEGGLGLAWCRSRKAPAPPALVTQRSQPPDVFRPSKLPKPDRKGPAKVTFASTENPDYQRMLAIIRSARAAALSKPRVDMPGAEIIPGACRHILPVPLPADPLTPAASVDDGVVTLRWPRRGDTIGLSFELHRGTTADFTPTDQTLLERTTLFAWSDGDAPSGTSHYALVAVGDGERSDPARTSVKVSPSPPPAAPEQVTATAVAGAVRLQWRGAPGLRYHVYRSPGGAEAFARVTSTPVAGDAWTDTVPLEGGSFVYRVRSVNRRGRESESGPEATATVPRVSREAVFEARFNRKVARLRGAAKLGDGILDVRGGGHAEFANRPEFSASRGISVTCRVRIDKPAKMPVVLSCGMWQKEGWFLQNLGGKWRWYVGGASCDGGKSAPGAWTHLVVTFDGTTSKLYQDGKLVGSAKGRSDAGDWSGPLVIGQYSAPAESYQVFGQIAGVRVYRVALTEKEVAAAFRAGRRESGE